MAGLGTDPREVFLVCKSAQTDLTNDNTLNDDAHLTYPLYANEVVHFTLESYYVAGAGGIRISMNGPAGYVSLNFNLSLDVSGAKKTNAAVAVAYDTVLTSNVATGGLIRITGFVQNGATAGNLVFRWAQMNSNGATTSIFKGSRLMVYRCF